MGKIFRDWEKLLSKYNKNVQLFIISSVFVHIGMGIFMIIYHYYIRELGYDDQMNSSIIAMQSATTALVLLPAGTV